MPNRPGNDDRITAGGIGSNGGQGNSANDNGSQNGSSRSRSNRGFASMDREKQREIASKGGRAAHAKGTAHEFDSGEAREAGRKGGLAVSQNREHMAKIGRRGGEARGAARGRSAGVTNSGATGDESSTGGFQNSRGGMADREVSMEGTKANTQGNRGANNSVNGERAGNNSTFNNDQSSRGESFGNR